MWWLIAIGAAALMFAPRMGASSGTPGAGNGGGGGGDGGQVFTPQDTTGSTSSGGGDVTEDGFFGEDTINPQSPTTSGPAFDDGLTDTGQWVYPPWAGLTPSPEALDPSVPRYRYLGCKGDPITDQHRRDYVASVTYTQLAYSYQKMRHGADWEPEKVRAGEIDQARASLDEEIELRRRACYPTQPERRYGDTSSTYRELVALGYRQLGGGQVRIPEGDPASRSGSVELLYSNGDREVFVRREMDGYPVRTWVRTRDGRIRYWYGTRWHYATSWPPADWPPQTW